MGLISAVTDWAKDITQNNVATSTTKYVYTTIAYLFEQVGAVPRVVHTLVTDPPSRAVPAHLLRITGEDLAPLVLLPYISHLMLQKAQALLENAPESEDWLSAETAINTAILLLHVLTVISWIYSLRAKIEFFVRTLAVSLEAPILFSKDSPSTAMTVCKDEGCTQLRFLKGAVRDLVAYEATEALIYSIRMLSPLLANSLLIFHRGDYLLTLALPNLCNRHQVAYLWKHSDLALSLGLGHMLSTWGLNNLVQGISGIPSSYYYNELDLFTLILYIGIATHLHLPQAPKTTETKGSRDPIAFYQKGVGVVFDALMQKLKAHTPQLINIRQYHRLQGVFSNPSWSRLSVPATISWHVLAYIFLPRMLQSTHSFIHDPIIRTNWPTLQSAIVYALKEAIAAKTNVAVKTLSFFPGTTGVVAWFTLGVPSALTKFVLQLITNDEFIYQLNRWQEQIEKLSLKKIEPVVPIRNVSMPLLRGQTRAAAPVVEESIPLIDAPIQLPPPEEVIKLLQPTKRRNKQRPQELDWEVVDQAKLTMTKTAANESSPTFADTEISPTYESISPQASEEWVSIKSNRFFKEARDPESWVFLASKSAGSQHNHVKGNTSL